MRRAGVSAYVNASLSASLQWTEPLSGVVVCVDAVESVQTGGSFFGVAAGLIVTLTVAGALWSCPSEAR